MVAVESLAVASTTIEGRQQWKPRRPTRGAPDGEQAISVREPNAGGVSNRAAARMLGPSRRSIARTLAADGALAEPGRPVQFRIDPDWLTEQHGDRGRSVADLAREVGCRCHDDPSTPQLVTPHG